MILLLRSKAFSNKEYTLKTSFYIQKKNSYEKIIMIFIVQTLFVNKHCEDQVSWQATRGGFTG